MTQYAARNNAIAVRGLAVTRPAVSDGGYGQRGATPNTQWSGGRWVHRARLAADKLLSASLSALKATVARPARILVLTKPGVLLALGLLVGPPEASAQKVHALTKNFYKKIQREFCEKRATDIDCGVPNRCSKTWTKTGGQDNGLTGGAWAIEEWEPNCTSLHNSHGGKNPSTRFGHWTHAHHHGGSFLNASADSASVAGGGIPPDPPIPGDPVTEQYLDVRYTNTGEDSFTIDIDANSFLQVYMGNVEPGETAEIDWKVTINNEISRVRLVGRALDGGGVSVIPSMDGLFTGLPFTLTENPNGTYVLSFGALQFTEAGTVEGSDLGIESGDPEPCITPPPGMVAWYTGDDTTPTDHLALHDGTFVGFPVSAVDWKVGGGALETHAPDTYVTVPDPTGVLGFGNPGQNFSIDAWIKVEPANSPGVRPIVDKRVQIGDAVWGYQLFLFNGALGFQMADGAPGGPICAPSGSSCTHYISATNVADGLWHLVAVTVDRAAPPASQVTLYVDGSAFPMGAARGNTNNNAPLLIGSGYPIVIAQPYFTGLIDELEIFDRALTAAEVQGIYFADSNGKCKCTEPPSDMVAWYPGDDTTPYDELGNAPGSYVGTPVSPVDQKVGGGALDFHSPGTYVVVPNGPNFGTGDFSIDMWVNTSANAGLQTLVDKRVPSAPGALGAVGYAVYLVNGTLSVQLADPANAHFNYNSNLFVADGNWNFVAVTVDRDNPAGLVLNVNGARQTFNPTNRQGNLDNTGALVLGARPPSLGLAVFDGLMDEIEFFDRALTQVEVDRIHRADEDGKCKAVDPDPLTKGSDDRCVGGVNNGQPCAQDSDCPGGACRLKNRFITAEIPSTSKSHGILVSIVSLDSKSVATPANYNGTERWVGPPQIGISDGISPPFNAARLQCGFHSQDWTDVGELHIYGDVVVPGSTYDASICSAEAGPCSAPLRLATAKFGDVVTPVGTTNFQDVNAVVAKFQGTLAGPSKTRTKLTGSILNPLNPINFQEVSACVAAFQSKQFKTVVTAPPATCP